MQKAEDEASRLVGDAQIKTAQAELMTEFMRRERDEARAIISDLLEERGESWLTKLAGRREELLGFLRRTARRFEWVDGGAVDHDADHCSQEYCGRRCRQANVLRIVGGEAETQRQVDAAHEAAISSNPWQRLQFGEWAPSHHTEMPVRGVFTGIAMENAAMGAMVRVALNPGAVTAPPLNAVRSASDLRDPSHSPRRPK